MLIFAGKKPKAEKKTPVVDHIASLVFPKNLKGFAARYILLKLVKQLVQFGFMSATQGRALKSDSIARKREFKASVDLTKIADEAFMKEDTPNKKSLVEYLTATKQAGISEKRALDFLRELFDRATLDLLDITASVDDYDVL